MIGRGRERAVLSGVLDRAAAGAPSFVLVTGEAGIGKTTLVDDFARMAQRSGHRVVRGSAADHDLSGLALWEGPFAALGIAGDARSGAQRLDGRWEVIEVVAGALEVAAPIVVVLEDIHWADSASLWLLGRLPGVLAGDVVIVATSRQPGIDRLRPGITVALGGLSTAEVAAIIAEHDVGDAADPIEARELRSRTGGNPLFVSELLARRPDDSRLPPAIDAVLSDAFDALTPTTVRALAVLAIAEPQTPYAIIADAIGVDIVELRGAFDEAVAARVLVEVSAVRVGFRHALFGDAALAKVDAGEQRSLHRALADAWRRMSTEGEAPTLAARHGLYGIPLVDPVDAASAGRAAAVDLVAAGDVTGAVQLFSLAADALELYAAQRIELRAALLIELGDALMLLGENARASVSYEQAVALASVDPVVHARAVYGLTRKLQMYHPDPQRRALLEAAEHALPPGDSRLRALLLGRLAVANNSEPKTWARSHRDGESAVEMARRLGDAALLAETLIDRHLGSHDRNSLEQRAASADELVALGGIAGRSDLTLIGLQWKYGSAMMHGEIDSATAALDEMDTIAALMPSPEWRHGALLRRAIMAAVAGDVCRARRLIDEAAPIGRRILFAQEALGIESGARVVTSRLTGVADPAIGALLDEIDTIGGLPTAAFFQVHTAAAMNVAGRHDEARSLVVRWASACADAQLALEAPSIEVLLGSLVAEMGLAEHASVMYQRLVQYSGCFTVEPGFAVDVPVDLTLMRLAMFTGNWAAAQQHRLEALRIAATMKSPVLEAQVRWHGADALDAAGSTAQAAQDRRTALSLARGVGVVLSGQSSTSTTPPGDRPASLRRCGATWAIESPYGSGEIANTAAIGQLARLLAASPEGIAATDLAGMTDVAPANDLGPALDATAKRAYRQRIEALRAEIDEDEDLADLERATRARLELDALMIELRRAVGLHGHDRPISAGAERARVNVARSLRRAIDAVRAAVPELGAHFDVSVRTGRWCTYAPEPTTALTWRIETS